MPRWSFEKVFAAWVWLVRQFLTDPENPTDLRQTQIILITAIVLVLIAGPFAIQYWSLGLPWMSFAVIMTMIFGLIDVAIFKVKKDVVLCGTIATFCVYLLLIVSNISSGGFYDPNFSWFYVIPIMGMVVANQKMGWFWTLVIVLTSWVFWMLPDWGVVFESRVAPEDHAGQSFANRLSAIIALSGLGTAFLTSQQSAENKMRRALSLLSVEVEERKEAEAKAHAASQAKSDFLANMSHEIRTPMNGVLGMISILLKSELDDEQRDQARTVKHSAEALLTIINDVLDYSKIEAGFVNIETEAFNVQEIIEEVCCLVRPTGEQKGLTIRYESPLLTTTDEFEVVGDPGRVRQVLMNLVGNAIKFTDAGAVTLKLSWEQTEGETVSLLFEVLDDGIGIAADKLDAVFGKFTQADESTTRNYGGTGLGLAISKQLVDLMEGEIGVKSEPGRGSNFWFRLELPIQKQIAKAASTKEEAKVAVDARVLVADNNKINRTVARTILNTMKCEVYEVTNGQEACDLASEIAFDLILMDCMMPVMDGFHATEILRGRDTDKRLPIIAMTTKASAADRSKCLASGMDDVITKPLLIQRFVSVIQEYLDIEEN